MPQTVVQLFVASSGDGDAFGATIVSGGDADLDTAAAHVADAVGRVITAMTTAILPALGLMPTTICRPTLWALLLGLRP